MKEWQFNILFFVGVGSALFLLVAPEFGLDISSNPTALAGVGSILTYILTQKKTFTKRSNSKSRRRPPPRDDLDEEPFLGHDDEIDEVPSVYGDPDDEKGDDR